jgi:D-amino-acid dehydrogenase
MEIVSTTTPPRYHRVEGIRKAVSQFLPEFILPEVAQENIWYGYRPTSADGLPYIGRISKWRNVIVATGHSMLGLSLGAGTGKIVNDLVSEQAPGMDLTPFAVERFA